MSEVSSTATGRVVWQILSDLHETRGVVGCYAAFARVARELRRQALAPSSQLTRIQRERLVDALRGAFQVNYATFCTQAEQNVFLTSLNALGTLVLSWAGDSRWPPDGDRIFDARDLAHAFEHEMRRLAVLDEMLARRQPMQRSHRDSADTSEETAS